MDKSYIVFPPQKTLKSGIKILCILIITGILGCEEVVQVDLEESEPRLVIDASLLRDKENPSSMQTIRLTTTAPFFEDRSIPAKEATVLVRDSSGREYIFDEIESGYYRNNNLYLSFDRTYELEILYEGELYTASENLIPVASLENVEQTTGGGFTGDNIELKVFYTDPVEERNYYLFRLLHEDLSLQIYDDEFTNGNRTFAYFSDEDLRPGDEVRFEVQGMSRRFYEYMFILRSQAGSGGGPFQTQPTTVRGNVINVTNPQNYALGYFRIAETDYLNYTVE
ncbi:DUF4249 domain-containing protein [Antarcticibacterium arcticum]|uniref:DUF4249 domain-containing protein n=1 Tax=Antarcticibacterium arcticum TaxID=2585771 RepID=A0A5B8YIY2_9FLAO|nr:DUF4249 domain-containing protein [Antarcticibacterium arcticum]QED36356.1 DUF4249 domain-containing protein [Antarcticibacterium arcticum]